VSGDPSAWETVVDRYAPLVYAVARHCGLASTDAEDCAQQTWLALYRQRRSILDPMKLPGWLTQTTRRKATRMRSRRRRSDEVNRQLPSPEPAVPIDQAIETLEQRALLELAMEQLDPRCYKLLRAIFLSPDDTSYRDIARELAIPLNSVGPTRSRCLKKLKKILESLE